MHARIYDFTLGAGGMQTLPVVGDYFKILSATGQVNIVADTGATLDVIPGQGLRQYPFNTLSILDKTGAANTGKILIGFSSMVDDRITGEVSVIDGAKSRTLAGLSFLGAAASVAVAGNYSMVQLKNPAGSGKNIILEQVDAVLSGAAGLVGIGPYGADLASIWGVGSSKRINGAASVMQVRYGAPAALPASGMLVGGVSAGVSYQRKFIEPVVIGPGADMTLWASVVNTRLDSSFEWYEDPL